MSHRAPRQHRDWRRAGLLLALLVLATGIGWTRLGSPGGAVAVVLLAAIVTGVAQQALP